LDLEPNSTSQNLAQKSSSSLGGGAQYVRLTRTPFVSLNA